MAKIDLPKEGISVQEFFTKYVPENLGKAIGETSPQGMDGTEVSIQFNITGEGGAKYAIKMIDGKKIEIAEGGVPNPMMEIENSVADWRDSISPSSELGGVLLEQMMDPSRFQVTKKNFDVMKAAKGKMEIQIIRPGKEPFRNIIRFNKGDAPAAVITMAQDDFKAIAGGKVDPQVAFMSGKIKVKGDISLLIKLMPLASGMMGGKK
jgi:putative sterol carrier protein